MPKKLTITLDGEVYDGLHSVIGRRRISRFINDLARPHVVGQDLSAGCLGRSEGRILRLSVGSFGCSWGL